MDPQRILNNSITKFHDFIEKKKQVIQKLKKLCDDVFSTDWTMELKKAFWNLKAISFLNELADIAYGNRSLESDVVEMTKAIMI
ncbi:MAG: hypothetical protein ACJA2Z_000023 [Candidatus Paceibacteria bacterium]|jgi:hypothetical protein